MEVSSQLYVLQAVPWGMSPLYPLLHGWVGPRASQEAVKKNKTLVPAGNGPKFHCYPALSFVLVPTQ
jgi:hypothetical protein